MVERIVLCIVLAVSAVGGILLVCAKQQDRPRDRQDRPQMGKKPPPVLPESELGEGNGRAAPDAANVERQNLAVNENGIDGEDSDRAADRLSDRIESLALQPYPAAISRYFASRIPFATHAGHSE